MPPTPDLQIRSLTIPHNNQNYLWLGLGIVCFAGSVLCAYCSRESADLGLVCYAKTHDFGKVVQGDRLATVFTIKNTSRVATAIVHVQNNCDCSKVVVSSKNIEPREVATVEVEWDVGCARGRTHRDVTIFYTPEGSVDINNLVLQITAEVIPDFNYEPSQLRFHDDTDTKQCIAFTPCLLEDVLILRAISTHQAFDVQVQETRSLVIISFNPSLWHEDSRAEIVVETTSEKEPRVRIPVTVEKGG